MSFTFQKSDLKATFEWLSGQTYQGVDGVFVYDSGTEGPTFGVTIHTHGNEPCGLAALAAFRALIEEGVPYKGRVLFMINNLAASRIYWEEKHDPAELKYRFLDCNMNRIPTTFDATQAYDEAELNRVKELLPLWQMFDVAIDFHTTSQEAPAMVIANGSLPVEYVSALPLSHYLEGVSTAIRSDFVTKYYGSDDAEDMYMIECGQHEAESAFSCAAKCFLSLMQSYDLMHDVYTPENSEALQVYKVTDSCFFPDESYEQVRIFENFAPMDAGQVLAEGNGEPVCAPFNGHILMAPSVKKPAYITEEAYFFSQPVVKVARAHGSHSA